MAILLPQRWRQQPQGPVTIDRGNPLSSGLTFAMIPEGKNRQFNIALNKIYTHSGQVFGTTPVFESAALPYGRAVRPQSGSSAWGSDPFVTNTPLSGTNVFTMAIIGRRGSVAADMEGLFGLAGDSLFGHSGLRVSPLLRNIYQPGGANFVGFFAKGAEDQRSLGVASPSLNQDFVLIFTYKNSTTTNTVIKYGNGSIAAGTGTALTANYSTSGTAYTWGGAGPSGAWHYGTFIWNRAFTESEQRAFVQNEWQLFKPQRPKFYSFPISYARPQKDITNRSSIMTTSACGGSAVFLPQRWRRQPEGRVQIDWNNPLSQGLVYANLLGSTNVDTITGISAITTGAKQQTRQYGVARGFGSTLGTGATDIIRTQSTPNFPRFTASVFAYRQGQPAYAARLFAGGSGISTSVFALAVGATDGVAFFYTRLEGGFFQWDSEAAGNVPNGAWTRATLSMDSTPTTGTLPKYYTNGLPRSMGAAKGAGALWASNAGGFTVGNRLGSDRLFEGLLQDFFIWNRLLSDAEVRAQNENPYQVFKPKNRVIYIDNTGWTRVP